MSKKFKTCTGPCGRELEENEENFSYRRKSEGEFQPWCKQCTSEYKKKYYKENKSKIQEYKKEYYEQNEEFLKLKSKNNYRKKNGPPKIKTKRTKEEIAEYKKNWYKIKNKDKIQIRFPQKHNEIKNCKTCKVELNDENWPKYFQKSCWYMCKNCKAIEKNLQSKIDRLKIKVEVIFALGGKCVDCGITDIDLLTIDHINNNGGKHRAEIKTSICNWLKKNNYPSGFQILCFNCNCTKHFYTNVNSSKKNKNLIYKEKVLNHYGQICVGCGESDIKKLTLDHINNDGNKHRREIGGQSAGINMYRWVIKNNYPNGIFQVMCWNCNCGKRVKRDRATVPDSDKIIADHLAKINKK